MNDADQQARGSWHRYTWLCLLFGMMDIAAAQGEIRDVVNELRAGGCDARSKLPPLTSDARLQNVTKRVANGATALAAANDAAYPATQLSTIHLTGYTRDADVRSLLAQRYCKLLLNPEWQQLGSDWRNDELWLVLAAPHAIPGDTNAVAAQVLALVNQARANNRRCGKERFAKTAPLRLNATLNKAAQLHAQDMTKHRQMQHEGSDGSTPAQRVTRLGYRWKVVGENVAAGAGSAEEVVSGWLNSPGHCANIMNPQFIEMGLAFAVNKRDDYAVYWAQSFATPRK